MEGQGFVSAILLAEGCEWLSDAPLSLLKQFFLLENETKRSPTPCARTATPSDIRAFFSSRAGQLPRPTLSAWPCYKGDVRRVASVLRCCLVDLDSSDGSQLRGLPLCVTMDGSVRVFGSAPTVLATSDARLARLFLHCPGVLAATPIARVLLEWSDLSKAVCTAIGNIALLSLDTLSTHLAILLSPALRTHGMVPASLLSQGPAWLRDLLNVVMSSFLGSNANTVSAGAYSDKSTTALAEKTEKLARAHVKLDTDHAYPFISSPLPSLLHDWALLPAHIRSRTPPSLEGRFDAEAVLVSASMLEAVVCIKLRKDGNTYISDRLGNIAIALGIPFVGEGEWPLLHPHLLTIEMFLRAASNSKVDLAWNDVDGDDRRYLLSLLELSTLSSAMLQVVAALPLFELEREHSVFVSITSLSHSPRQLPEGVSLSGDFLKAASQLCPRLYEKLGITLLTAGEMYSTYILPSFPAMDKDNRRGHMDRLSKLLDSLVPSEASAVIVQAREWDYESAKLSLHTISSREFASRSLLLSLFSFFAPDPLSIFFSLSQPTHRSLFPSLSLSPLALSSFITRPRASEMD